MPNMKHVLITAAIAILAIALAKKFAPTTLGAYV